MNRLLILCIMVFATLYTQAGYTVGYCNQVCTYSTPCSTKCLIDGSIQSNNSSLANLENPNALKMTSCLIYGVCNNNTNPPQSYVVPSYYPSYWNNSSYRKRNNNCYNYAANKVTNNFAQPGYASGNRGFSSNRTCQGVISGANSDSGITRISSLSQVGTNETALAVVVARGYDYHWYRRDSNNRWSHKPGSTSASNKDNSNRIITNPITANRGIYKDFCGYYKTKSKYTSTSSTHQNKGTANISGTFKSKIKLIPTEIDGITAEILIFSGMPNPKINITADKLAFYTLGSLLQEIDSKTIQSNQYTNNSFIDAKLGYKGILLKDNSGQIIKSSRKILINRNQVRIKNDQNPYVDSYSTGQALLEKDIINQALLDGMIDYSLHQMILNH